MKKKAPGLGRLGGDLPKPKGILLAQARAEVFAWSDLSHGTRSRRTLQFRLRCPSEEASRRRSLDER